MGNRCRRLSIAIMGISSTVGRKLQLPVCTNRRARIFTLIVNRFVRFPAAVACAPSSLARTLDICRCRDLFGDPRRTSMRLPHQAGHWRSASAGGHKPPWTRWSSSSPFRAGHVPGTGRCLPVQVCRCVSGLPPPMDGHARHRRTVSNCSLSVSVAGAAFRDPSGGRAVSLADRLCTTTSVPTDPDLLGRRRRPQNKIKKR